MTVHDSPTGPASRGPGTPGASGGHAGHTRLRFPGGRLGPADWTVLARLASEHSGDLYLKSRGIVEFRGAPDQVGLWERVEAVGMSSRVLREGSHTILASPLAGLLPGRCDLGDLPECLDAALTDHADVASPAVQILFGLDDGSGDVLAHGPDLAAVAGPGGALLRIHAAGRDTGLATPIADVVSVLVAVAGIIRSPDGSPSVSSSGELHELVVALSDNPLTTRMDLPPTSTTAAAAPSVGWIDTIDGLVTLLAVVPDGVVPARLAEFLGAIERPSTISADRVIGLHGLTEGMAEQAVRVLAPMGMVFDAASPWVEAARRTL